jgi:DNA-binding CsgD family transcriptional regulator
MTSPLFTRSTEPLGVGSLLSYRAPRRQANHLSVCRGASLPAHRSTEYAIDGTLQKDLKLDRFSRQLLELMPQGVLVVSSSLNLLYWNQKAKAICLSNLESTFGTSYLPPAVLEACHRMMRENLPISASLVQEYLVNDGQTIRVTVRWLEDVSEQESRSAENAKLIDADRDGISQETQLTQPRRSLLAVFLENCDEVLKADLQVQRKKYDLTERESEIWLLLRKEYSYQKIAGMLQISLNTVKTHVKNIYAKRRSYQDREPFWCCESGEIKCRV